MKAFSIGAVLIIAVTLAASSGCGSSKAPPRDPPLPPTPAEYFRAHQVNTVTPHGKIDIHSVKEATGKIQYKTMDGKQWRVTYSKNADGTYGYGTPETISANKGESAPKIEMPEEWAGTCAQPDMGPYPMIMSITKKGDEISGTIKWPTLRNSTTQFTGTIAGTKVRFVETELIEGSNVGVPCIYEGDLLGNTIAGTCTYTNLRGTFFVTRR